MDHVFVTAGERLAAVIYREHISQEAWSRVIPSLRITGRARHYIRYFRELSSVALACRLVSIARSILDPDLADSAASVEDPIFRRRLTPILRDRLEVFDDRQRAKLFRAITDAVLASAVNLNDTIRRVHRSFAMRHNLPCYMCGTTMDFVATTGHARFTLEHIWPQCYGGQTIDDNLLPACDSCNSSKKRNFASWAMVAVHSVALGLTPSANAIDSVDGTIRFALHHFAAWQYAAQRRTTLKAAFQQIGPWTDLWLRDSEDDADFFNLANHQEIVAFNLE